MGKRDEIDEIGKFSGVRIRSIVADVPWTDAEPVNWVDDKKPADKRKPALPRLDKEEWGLD